MSVSKSADVDVSKSVSAAVGSVSKSLDISKAIPSVSVSKSADVSKSVSVAASGASKSIDISKALPSVSVSKSADVDVSKSVSAAVGSVSKSLDISKSLPSVSVSKSVEVGLCSVRGLEVPVCMHQGGCGRRLLNGGCRHVSSLRKGVGKVSDRGIRPGRVEDSLRLYTGYACTKVLGCTNHLRP